MGVVAEGVRPNIERDMLAGFELPTATSLGHNLVDVVLKEAPLFSAVSLKSSSVPMYFTNFGEVREERAGHEPKSPRLRQLGQLVTIKAVTPEVITFVNEGEYADQVMGVKQTARDIFRAIPVQLEERLIDTNRSARTAAVAARSRVYSNFNNLGIDGTLLCHDGTPRANLGSVSYVTMDRVCDPTLEGTDDAYAPTLRNVRDVPSLAIVQIEFSSAAVVSSTE